MNIKSACELLGAQGKILLEVAKHYNFKDDNELAAFVNFTAHEPAAWLSGLPSTFNEKKREATKAAFVKLMKNEEIRTALGSEVCDSARKAVWDQFKALKAEAKSEMNEDARKLEVVEPTEAAVDAQSVQSVQSIHSVKKVRGAVKTENRITVLESALRKFILAEESKNPGLSAVALTLLDAYCSSSTA